MDNNQIEVIALSEIIDIKISGGFYSRLHQLFMKHLELKSPADVFAIVNELKTREPKDIWEYDYITLHTLVSEIDSAAREQGKTKMGNVSDIITNKEGS